MLGTWHSSLLLARGHFKCHYVLAITILPGKQVVFNLSLLVVIAPARGWTHTVKLCSRWLAHRSCGMPIIMQQDAAKLTCIKHTKFTNALNEKVHVPYMPLRPTWFVALILIEAWHPPGTREIRGTLVSGCCCCILACSTWNQSLRFIHVKLLMLIDTACWCSSYAVACTKCSKYWHALTAIVVA